jgi:DNA-binding protein Alba
MVNELVEQIFIGDKDIKNYMSACFYALNNNVDEIHLIARGNNIKRAIDVADILMRQYLDISEKIPTLDDLENVISKEDYKLAKKYLKLIRTCEIKIGSEKFGERNVSTIDIVLRGKKKNVPVQFTEKLD